jgi:hypothetical protein
MTKIKKLTDSQIAAMPRYVEEYLRRGLATEPADRLEAERAIADAYRMAHLPPPQAFIWLGSPLAGGIASAILVRDQVWEVWAQVEDLVRAQVRAQVGAQVWAQVGEVRAQVGAQVGEVWAQVAAQVRAQVGEVRAQVGAQVVDQVWAQVGDQTAKAGYGSHDSDWLAFYRFFRDECGLSIFELLDPLDRLSRAAGWWWPFKHICIVTERPDRLERDEQHRLHCADGPALRYPDGWSIYAWHGTRIPAEWIEDKSALTAKVALSQTNIELRRAAIDIVGWHRILRELDATTIDEHPDPAVGALLEVQLPDLPTRSRFLRVLCGTRREFAIGVPNECNSAIEAQAWLTGMPEGQFQLPTTRS